MPRGPAARVGDPVVHPLPPVLQPGPGSLNVIIGGKPAWRGVPAAAAAAVNAAKSTSDTAIKTAEAATLAAAGTPGAPAAKAAEETVKATAATTMGSMITGSAGGADIHVCATPLPLPPHGPGVVIDGSPTVLTNSLQACRQMDTIIEAVGPPNKISMGCLTVIIGDQPGAPNNVVTGLGADVDDIINKSDSLAAALEKLKADKWTVVYGPPGKGSITDRGTKTIYIDPAERGNPAAVAQSVAHEAGHALYTPDPDAPMAGRTKQEWVDENVKRQLKDEGEATLVNAQVRNEINGNGGPDIGMAGQHGPEYQTMAESNHDYENRDQLRQDIGDRYGQGEVGSRTGKRYGDKYAEYYGSVWDNAHPPPPPP
jgi:uncharacterized Zn-binding protein involved in type VI secretion